MDSLSIILPVFNERDTIGPVIAEWHSELERLGISHLFIVCEDGSTDGTKEVLTELQGRFSIQLEQGRERRGYGAAVLAGIRNAPEGFILCTDSDGQPDPADFEKFWTHRNNADILIGNRVRRRDSAMRRFFSRGFGCFFRVLFPVKLNDPSAPYVLFRRATVLQHLGLVERIREAFWWGFVGMASKTGLTLLEIPINHRERLHGETQVYKIKKLPGIAVRNITAMVRIRFS